MPKPFYHPFHPRSFYADSTMSDYSGHVLMNDMMTSYFMASSLFYLLLYQVTADSPSVPMGVKVAVFVPVSAVILSSCAVRIRQHMINQIHVNPDAHVNETTLGILIKGILWQSPLLAVNAAVNLTGSAKSLKGDIHNFSMPLFILFITVLLSTVNNMMGMFLCFMESQRPTVDADNNRRQKFNSKMAFHLLDLSRTLIVLAACIGMKISNNNHAMFYLVGIAAILQVYLQKELPASYIVAKQLYQVSKGGHNKWRDLFEDESTLYNAMLNNTVGNNDDETIFDANAKFPSRQGSYHSLKLFERTSSQSGNNVISVNANALLNACDGDAVVRPIMIAQSLYTI